MESENGKIHKRFTYKIRRSLQCDKSGMLLSLFDFNSLRERGKQIKIEGKREIEIEHHSNCS